MDETTLMRNVSRLAAEFARERRDRQRRRGLAQADFDALGEAGFPLVALPADEGGLWKDVRRSVRPICEALRTLAGGDSSVALVAAMHPAVLSYWLTAPVQKVADEAWTAQCRSIFESLRKLHWWGTITSEPGSGGDVNRTRATAERGDSPLEYRLSGLKHFGSGLGVMSYMVTTALPEGEADPDWFFLDMQDVPWDGSRGVTLVAEWDGHGMAATNSHTLNFEQFPATRIALTGQLAEIAARTGGFIGCLFTSVIVGIVDVACETAAERFDPDSTGPFETVERARTETESWLIRQAYEGMLRAVEQSDDPRPEVLKGKTAVAELAESVMTRLCRLIGGGSYSRHSPFGFWFEDVRALGFLRPPWSLAFEGLIDGLAGTKEEG